MGLDAAGQTFKDEAERLKLALYCSIAELCESDRSALSTIIDFFDDYDEMLRFLFVFGGETIKVPSLDALTATFPVATAALARVRGDYNGVLPKGVTAEHANRVADIVRKVLARKDKAPADRQAILRELGL